MKLEEKARQDIDKLLSMAGWTSQDREEINLGDRRGVAVREYPTDIGTLAYQI